MSNKEALRGVDGRFLSLTEFLPQRETKRCGSCGVVKLTSEFRLDSGSPDGHDYRCRDCRKGEGHSWYMSNREKHNLDERNQHERLRLDVIALLGGACVWPGCGATDARILQLSHKFRKKFSERKEGKNVWQLYRMILRGERSKDDFQLLCANHHILYDIEHGIGYRNNRKIP